MGRQCQSWEFSSALYGTGTDLISWAGTVRLPMEVQRRGICDHLSFLTANGPVREGCQLLLMVYSHPLLNPSMNLIPGGNMLLN